MTTSPNLDIKQAAEFLKCAPRFLEDNLKRLPHQKLGQSVAFDLDDLAEIKDMFRVRPGARSVRPAPAADVSSLSRIRPKGARIS
ncbi:hypothetical protein ACF1BN_15985 [Streptomyces sp. NPDC014861]|uniref:hypothetical protein n=1 Tax=Streptomyces sp. NPDC014861 TaxID=3364923 RepID=UPI0036F532E4